MFDGPETLACGCIVEAVGDDLFVTPCCPAHDRTARLVRGESMRRHGRSSLVIRASR